MEGVVVEPVAGLEGVILCVDRVHVAGEDHAALGLGAHRNDEMAAMGDRAHAAFFVDFLDRGGIDQPHVAGQRGKGVCQPPGHRRDAVEIGGAAIDRRPC